MRVEITGSNIIVFCMSIFKPVRLFVIFLSYLLPFFKTIKLAVEKLLFDKKKLFCNFYENTFIEK